MFIALKDMQNSKFNLEAIDPQEFQLHLERIADYLLEGEGEHIIFADVYFINCLNTIKAYDIKRWCCVFPM